MMEVHDELLTPGCPQCAVKHLSAALYHVAKGVLEEGAIPDPYMTAVCTAYINLTEVRSGYLSHLWYAVGALVRAEECMAARTGACVAREARLMLEERGADALLDAMACLREGTAPSHADWAAAHFNEARRELPAMADGLAVGDLVGSIERVREEFFSLPEAAVAEGESQAKEGEPEMATIAKKCAAKGAKCVAKGAKCAAKGGKTAAKATKAACKGACKGGKCSKGKK